MRKTTALKSSLITTAALASALGLVSSASAATTWTVSGFPTPPAGVTYTSTDAKLDGVTCTLATATVTGTNGTGLSGTGLAHVTTAAWSGCSGPLGLTVSLTAQNLPWNLNAVSYDSATGVTTGTVTNVEAHISIGGVGCTADLRGSSSTTPATLDFRSTNSARTVSFPGTDNLHYYNVSGSCLGLFNSGDQATYTADYVTTSPVTITSP